MKKFLVEFSDCAYYRHKRGRNTHENVEKRITHKDTEDTSSVTKLSNDDVKQIIIGQENIECINNLKFDILKNLNHELRDNYESTIEQTADRAIYIFKNTRNQSKDNL